MSPGRLPCPCSWQPYFIVDKTVAFVQQFGIKLIHSFPYYAHANGQVEAINRNITTLIKKTLRINLENDVKHYMSQLLPHPQDTQQRPQGGYELEIFEPFLITLSARQTYMAATWTTLHGLRARGAQDREAGV
ncbi:hypothetical protein MTR_4g068750 [Medicago truncatula]|uniref:Integrase catalytic domain-containing protein n=1 Tax=Medicago truncatula TaxID=3880 RepID=A0A072ULY5_MEDTR|nr:hypothetical protein MTR_4g068750 [Medicago truncatula]